VQSFIEEIREVPIPHDQERAVRAFSDFIEACNQLEIETLDSPLGDLLKTDRCRSFLEGVFGNSAYLSRLCVKHADFVTKLLGAEVDALLKITFDDVSKADSVAEDEEQLLTLLRVSKARIAILTAFSDLAGIWTLQDVTHALTKFADIALQTTINFLLQNYAARGKVVLPDGRTSKDTGIFVLGMGKYGACELNYSSDIDLIVFFDQEKLQACGVDGPQDLAIKVTKGVVRILQEITADGYVFRVDLRLRPDAGATQVALSTAAAHHYYESLGQNWERAAFIKARTVAGDLQAGEVFLHDLSPFIWRKYLDYAAIEDIHAIKRQIHAHEGHNEVAVEGHNIKLGRGGIREIEFFAQTQQLILGGRDETLRGRETCPIILQLSEKSFVEPEAAKAMVSAYGFLRKVEHRLQMIEDQQTHTLPSTREGIDHVSHFLGYENCAPFREDLLSHLNRVQANYSTLFEKKGDGEQVQGNLVFTGVDDDPETLVTLANWGFSNPESVSAAVRSWHHGRLRATRSERSRQILTQLLPSLLAALGRTTNPDQSFAHFARFLEGLPSGVQLFSLLVSNQGMLGTLTNALGMAPRLATHLSQNAGVLDAMLDTEFMETLPVREEIEQGFSLPADSESDFESVLDHARRWHKENTFRIGMQVLSGKARAGDAGRAFAMLADTSVEALSQTVMRELERRHGKVPGSEFGVLAMGKLGGREMTAASDLDLIVLYDLDDTDGILTSDGQRPLSAPQYFSRYTQRLINALTAPTAEGIMYEVDMRLRPSGNAGPVATRFASFKQYQASDAWTWEHMALTRARPIGCSPAFEKRIMAAIRDVLCRERDIKKTAIDILEMRTKVEKELGSDDPWDIKQVRGGLIDLEFTCQALQLFHAHRVPEVLDQNTYSAFKKIKGLNIIDPGLCQTLIDATSLYQRITQVLRISVDGPFDPSATGKDLRDLLTRAGEVGSFEELNAMLQRMEDDVRAAFHNIVEAKAA